MHVLLLGTGTTGVEGAMLAPFEPARRELEREFGVRYTRVDCGTLSEARAAVETIPCDVVFMMTSWREPVERVLALVRDLAMMRPRRRIVYLDSFDSTSSPYFAIVPYVDVYVKKQVLRDPEGYTREYAGGYIFTDYLARETTIDLAGWHFGSTIDPTFRDRMMVGWNLGAKPEYLGQLRRERVRSLWGRKRDIDVCCRVSLGKSEKREWYYEVRREAVERVSELSGRYRVLAAGGFVDTGEFIPRRRFLREMRRSRAVVSPFGWGEICYRDFEAVCAGALLIKPSVAHLRTEPDIFVEGETYVPVKWDLSDLGAQCDAYLGRQGEIDRITANARRALARYFLERRFSRTVAEIVDRAMRTETRPVLVAQGDWAEGMLQPSEGEGEVKR